nr:MAG TPA: hypothetical protein [Myoviridae sp. ctTS62]
MLKNNLNNLSVARDFFETFKFAYFGNRNFEGFKKKNLISGCVFILDVL